MHFKSASHIESTVNRANQIQTGFSQLRQKLITAYGGVQCATTKRNFSVF